MDLSFLCSGKPGYIRGGEWLPPASYSEDAGAGCLLGVQIFAPSVMKTEQPTQHCYLLCFLQAASETVRRYILTLVKKVFLPPVTTQRLQLVTA